MTEHTLPAAEDADAIDHTLHLGAIGLENFEPYLMNRIMARYNDTLREDIGKLNLTTAKMRTLAVLSVMHGPLIRELSVYAVVEQSTLSRALSSLEKDNLVRRETDANDTRATRIYLTQMGRNAFEDLWPSMSQAYQRMFDGVAPQDRAIFLSTLKQVLGNIRKHPI